MIIIAKKKTVYIKKTSSVSMKSFNNACRSGREGVLM